MMNYFHLISTFLDKTRPAAARIAEIEAILQLVVEPFSAGDMSAEQRLVALDARRYALNALRTAFLDGAEAAEVHEAVAQALHAALDQLRGQGYYPYREVSALLTQQVPTDQEGAFQSDITQLRQAMTIASIGGLPAQYGRDPRVLAVLYEAARHPDPTIRAAALQGLGELGELGVVVSALEDEAVNVRTMAAKVLRYYGLRQEAVVAALERALHDADLEVRVAAWVALRKLGLRPVFPGSPDQPGAEQQPPSETDAPQFAWRPFLEQWGRQSVLNAPEYGEELPESVVASGWVGSPGATEEQLQAAEQRLGRRLPPSYRQFLHLTNGWRPIPGEPLLPTEQVDLFWIKEPDWAEAQVDDWDADLTEAEHRVYGEQQDVISYRRAYLLTVLQIGEAQDGYVYLLNPEVVTPAGEWEAWLLGNKFPGVRRWPSFWEMMHAEAGGESGA
jgi:SMI1 / KNR4 family (SUKH-1)